MHTNNCENIGFMQNPPKVWVGQWQSGNEVIVGRVNFALYEYLLTMRVGQVPAPS